MYAIKKNCPTEIAGRSEITFIEWMKTKDKKLENFYQQDGYGAFSVNPAQTDIVIAYIANQKEHHRKKIFQDEYRLSLRNIKWNMMSNMCGIDYNYCALSGL